ncbi:uncharacterized protein [Coffea arabica]|uniref:Auxin-responsive protein SAUR71-like n=1 Tax=Coffea arabica TaxID=13443 RepID=A0ABM4U5H5_COFAR
MDTGKSKWKNNSMIKKLVVSLSFQSIQAKPSRMEGAAIISLSKSKSWHCTGAAEKSQQNHDDQYRTRYKVAPKGCFSVYVGPEKQRFVIKAECANHPLFKMLLDDAALEYGYSNEGPLLLPCDVDLFYKVLAEMDCGEEATVDDSDSSAGGGFACGSCSPFTPARRLRNGTISKVYSPYGLLTPPRLLKMNHF